MIAQHANLSYTYVDNVASWDEMEQMLLDGRLDMLTSVQKTPEREEKFAFSDTPISISSRHFFWDVYSIFVITINIQNT